MKVCISVMVLIAFALPSFAWADLVFQCDFGDTTGSLTGYQANTGQIWTDSDKGEVIANGSLSLGVAYGQDLTNGAGATQQGDNWLGNMVPLGQTLENGAFVWEFDMKRERTVAYYAGAEMSMSLMGTHEIALIWQGGSLKLGGSIVGLDGGAWAGTAIDMNLSKGSIHVTFEYDMEERSGSLTYVNLANEEETATVMLEPLTTYEPAVSFNSIYTTLRTIEEAMGYDNITLDYTPGAEPVAGDANGDGKVDGSDVTILAGNWQAGVPNGDTSNVTWSMGDFNGDGKVDGSDVTILAGNWQAGVTSSAFSVPEPSVATLLLLGVFALMGHGFRSRKS